MNIFKYLISFIILTVVTFAYNPKVYINVNTNKIYSGEDLVITLIAKADENANISFPAIDKISGYPIKNRGKLIVRKRVDDNTAQIYKEAKESFVIRPTKSLTVKDLKVNINNKSYIVSPIKITVLTKQDLAKSNKTFSLTMQANKNSVYVGEPLILTIRFIQPSNISISNLNLSKPSFDGFKVIQLNKGKVLQTNNSIIREVKYELLPKKSGIFNLKPLKVTYSLDINSQPNSPFNFFGTPQQQKTITSNSLKISVKKVPFNTDIVGDYIIKGNFKNNKFYKNSPITYIITIEGFGDLKDFDLPKIELDNVTSFAKPAKVIKQLKDGKIISILTKEYTFVSNVDFDIPQISIKSFSPLKNSLIILKTKPKHITLKEKKDIASILTNSSTPQQKSSKIKIENIINENNLHHNSVFFDEDFYKSKYLRENATYKYILTLILGIIIGVLSTIYLPILYNIILNRKEYKSSLYGSYQEALNILYPHTQDNKEIENMVTMLYEVINGNDEIKIDNKKLEKLVKEVLKKE